MLSRPGDDTGGSAAPPGGAWRRARLLVVVAALAGLIDVSVGVLPLGERLQVALHNGLQLAASAGAAWICIAEARRHAGRVRLCWNLVGAGAAAWAVGQAIWSWHEVVQGVEVPLPGLNDAAYLLLYPLAGAGLLQIAPIVAHRAERAGVFLDGILSALVLGALAWPTVLHESVHSAASPFAAAVTLSYPLADILLLSLVGGVLMRGRPAWLSGLGLAYLAFCFLLVADLGWTTGVFAGDYATGRVFDAGWVVGFLVLAAAARAPLPSRALPSDGRYAQLVGHVLPLTAVLAAVAAYLLDARVHDHGIAWQGLLASIVVLAVVRQALAAWEYQTSVKERLAAQTDFKALFENMTEGVAHCKVLYEGETAADFQYLRVNASFGPLTGLADVVGKRESEVIPGFAKTNADLLALLGRVAKGGPVEHVEQEVPGLRRWFSITAYPAGPEEFVAIFENITERKKTEERLRFQARLLDSVGQAIIATDAGGRITYWGPGAEALYGWRSPEVMGRTIVEVTPTETSQSQGAEILASLLAGRSWSGEFNVRRKDGSAFPALVRNDPVFDDGGHLVGVIGVSQDITAMKRLQSDLAQRAKERHALSAVAMHGAQSDDLSGILQEAVQALETAFLHADLWVEVHAGGKSAQSRGRRPDGAELRSGIPEGVEGGFVAVRYRSAHEHRDIGPFLHEEQLVIDSVADLLSTFVARQHAAERVRFQAHLLQSVSQAVTATDVEGRVTYWNPAAEALFGWTQSEALGRHISELWGEALVPVSGDSPSGGAQGDHFMTVRDGRALVVNMASSALLDPEGALQGFITITQDVTEARNREERLRLNEGRLREAQAVAHLGSWVFDFLDGTSVWSEETYRIFGQDPEAFEPTYDSMLAAVHPEDRALVAQRFKEAGESGDAFLMEHRIVLPDGTSKYVLENARFVSDDLGRVLRAVGTTQDVTESRAAEERERARQRETRKMLQILDQVQSMTKAGAWEYDPATDKVTWSKEMYRIHEVGEEFDLSHAENVLRFYDGADRERMVAAQQRMQSDAGPYDLEVSLTGAKGTKKTVRTLAVPQVEDGRIVRILGYVADITEQKRAEEARRLAEAKDLEVKRLEELNKMRMEFLNTAAHDLKTPLTPLRLAMGTLRLGSPNPLQKTSLDLMERNIARFQALVEDMLDAARLQAGRLKLRREAVSPNPLVEDAVASFQESARQAGLTLRVSTLPDARIDADPLKVMQVLMNLVSNSVKYTPRGGQILVEASTTPEEWEFRVRDSGLGMTSEQMSRLFQPFVRLHEEVPGTAKGTGLGLYISKGIVEQHGGRLWAESEGPGHGSTFHVAFPLAGSEAGVQKATDGPQAA